MNLNFTLFIEVLSFALLLFILSKLLYSPLLGLLDQRKKSVSDSLDQAKRLEEEAKNKIDQSARILKEAKDQILKMKEQARIEADDLKKSSVEQSRKDAQRITEEAHNQIDKELNSARQQIKKEAGDISIHVAEKLLRRNIDSNDHQRLVEEAIKELTNEPD